MIRVDNANYSALLVLALAAPVFAQNNVKLTEEDGHVTVTVDGELFTRYVSKDMAKPILYPIVGPYGVHMTRNYPMRKDVDNEATDHPHHESLWFTHDEVNGANFWSAHPSKAKAGQGMARVVQTEIKIDGHTLHAKNEWRDADNKVLFTDDRVIGFGSDASSRHIDYQITIHASHGDVRFGDTKEGTMAIRTHPRLRIDSNKKHGNHTAVGHAVNSEGHKDKDVWGKRAKWIDYFGVVEGHVVGIAIFDHPSNLRHPTWWHARTYGLVAANPFGVHDFEGKPDGTGDYTIANGSSLTQRYRFVFHQGDAESSEIEKRYGMFAAE